jgi:hypothetical protein
MGNEIYFRVTHGGYFWALWKTDGTEQGTRMVSESVVLWAPQGVVVAQPGTHYPGHGAPNPRRDGLQDLTVVDGRVWCYEFEFRTRQQAFVALRSFSSDGTTTRSYAGTFNFSEMGLRLSTIMPVGDKPHFWFGSIYPYVSNYGKWYTVDSQSRIVPADPATAPASYITYVAGITTFIPPGNGSTQAVLDDKRFYAFNDGVHGTELWVDDFSPPLSVHSMLPLDSSDAGAVDRSLSRSASIFADVVGITSEEETTIEGILKS